MDTVTTIESAPSRVVDEPDNGFSPSTPVPDMPLPPQRPTPFTDANNSEGQWDDITIDTEYHTDTGKTMLSVGYDGAPNVLVKHGSPRTIKVVKWTSSRTNAKPKILSPVTGDPNEVLINAIVYPASRLQEFNGTVNRVSGVYTYQLYQPKNVAAPGYVFPMGAPTPYVAGPDEQYYDTSTDLDERALNVSGILDPAIVTPLFTSLIGD